MVFEVGDGVIAVKTGANPKLHEYYKKYCYAKDYRNCRCAVNKISSTERHKLGLPY